MESKIEYKELCNRISSCIAIYEAADNGNDFIFKDFNKAAEKTDKTVFPQVKISVLSN